MFKVISHHFIGGVYCKEMEIPEDCQVLSHKHEFDHMSVLTQGCVIVDADGEIETYWSPAIINIKAGVQHSVLAVNGPAYWLCIHATDCTDESQVDNVLIKPVMKKLPFKANIETLNKQIEAHPELWNAYNMRTCYKTSPHREVSDIWLRYRSFGEFDPEHPERFSDKHESVWYPAKDKLPAVEWILEQLKSEIGDFELGGVLITKIPPGKQVYPHSDGGRWHADYYDRKILVLLSSAPKQVFHFESCQFEGETGEVFEFNNTPTHWVTNDSDVDRVSLIFAIRDKS